MASEIGESGETEERNTGEDTPPLQTSEAAVQTSEAETTTQAVPHVEGRRTQLRILRENIKSLSKDVGNFRKSHEASTKRLEEWIASLRKELKAHTRSKDVDKHTKNYEASSKRLEKEVATLRTELATLRSNIARDAARSKAKQEAMLSKILSKVSVKRSKSAKRTKKR